MTFETPLFWYDEQQSLVSKLLTPLSMLYAQGTTLHRALKTPQKIDIPVICIGNLNAGGVGKTPIAMMLMRHIQEDSPFQTPYFLSRGYGGRIMGPSAFVPTRHSLKDVGDEVFLLGDVAPTIVSKNRFLGAKLAQKNGADIIIMDDGMQNYDLVKDLQIVVIDGSMGFGNGQLIPAGPLRESLRSGLGKADLFVIIGEDETDVLKQLPTDKPIINAIVETTVPATEQERVFLAFAGLGWPEKFFSALRNSGANVVQAVSFPDHHPYAPNDMDKLLKRAEKLNARLITTRKDFMRIPSFYTENKKVEVAGMDVRWTAPDHAQTQLDSIFQRLAALP